jgi:hypothetical protein
VAALVTRLTAKDPQDRPASAAEAAGQAERLRGAQATTTAALPAPAVPITQPPTRPLTLAGAKHFPSACRSFCYAPSDLTPQNTLAPGRLT